MNAWSETAKRLPSAGTRGWQAAFVVAWLVVVPGLACGQVSGTYCGLFSASNWLHGSSGYLALTVGSGGGYSGYFLLDGRTGSLSGSFKSSGWATNIVVRRGTNPVAVVMNLNPTPGSLCLTGTISTALWTANLWADRAVWSSTTNNSPYAGRYTLIIPGDSGSGAVFPGGYGYGAVTVDAAGTVTVSGCLADGTLFSQGTKVSRDGCWPFYASLYGGKGSMGGWLFFTNASPPQLPGAIMTWSKPALGKCYPLGFTNQVAVQGFHYQPPAKGTRAINLGYAYVSFGGGNLNAPFTNLVTLGTNNSVTNAGPNPLTFLLSTGNGVFSGTVVPPGQKATNIFRGALIQDQNIGCGFVLGTNCSGCMALSPAPPPFTAQFLTEHASFSSMLRGDTSRLQQAQWCWADGTISTDYPQASIDFGSTGSRWQSLRVTPEDALTEINLGFSGDDGGWTNSFDYLDVQGVASVYFNHPLPHLAYWASSFNPIAGILDFSGFTSLQDIECYHCDSLQGVVVKNLPALRRVCFEACNLPSLDLSGDPKLEDVRGALNAFTHVTVGRGTGPKIWHWCTRDNPQLTQNLQGIMTNFYSLRELWIWNANQSGAISVVSTNLTSFDGRYNRYTSANFAGRSRLWECELSGNKLTNLVLTGCSSLKVLSADSNLLTRVALNNSPLLEQVNLSDNLLTSVTFAGKSRMWDCELSGNRLTNLVLTGCGFLRVLLADGNRLASVTLNDSPLLEQVDLANNRLTTGALDALLALMDQSMPNLSSAVLTNNPARPSAAGYAHYTSLVQRGVEIYVDLP